MADIELAIKMPEEYYNEILTQGMDGSHLMPLYKALVNSIPLPKGHGKLKDADELTKEIKGHIIDTSNLHYDDLEEAEAYNSAYYNCLDEIQDAQTIIESDKEESEDND